jgi:hypothetical protein
MAEPDRDLVRPDRMRDDRSGVFALMSAKACRDKVQRLIPAGLAETVALANQRREPVPAIDEVPCEFAFDAGGDAVRRAIGGLDLQYVAVFCPDIEAAADTAIRAHRLGAADARLAHLRLDFGNFENRLIAGLALESFDDVDHAVGRGL